MKHLTTPLTKDKLKGLKAGETVLLSGTIYTARDRAHQRLADLIQKQKKLPLDIKDITIYYCGPNIKKGKLGSCGPTTASRMDPFTEIMFQHGVTAVIGKGNRSPELRKVFKDQGTVFFVTHAGCAAYLRDKVKSFKVIAFPELGTEAIHAFEVRDFPLVVGIDTQGNDIYQRIYG